MQIRESPLNLKLRNYYLKFKNKLRNLIKEAKIAYYKIERHNSGNNMKLKWKIINDIIAKNKK
jgi:hypothetical protein